MVILDTMFLFILELLQINKNIITKIIIEIYVLK
jgi:hypothetical protein